jgi:hypothetical protein
MRKGLYFAIAVLFAACTQNQEKELVSQNQPSKIKQNKRPTSSPKIVLNDDSSYEAKADELFPTYCGRWFTINYPSSFFATPRSPIGQFEEYKFIETDEARFTSPDGSVEFFVFSPQWGGDPNGYLIQQSNEKLVSSSEEKANSDEPFSVSHHWVTYEDKEGKYTRSYHSLITESAHHVFGVKYTNRKMYERYKAAYLAFKKSLQQFAD